jgi:hypothetical protein
MSPGAGGGPRNPMSPMETKRNEKKERTRTYTTDGRTDERTTADDPDMSRVFFEHSLKPQAQHIGKPESPFLFFLLLFPLFMLFISENNGCWIMSPPCKLEHNPRSTIFPQYIEIEIEIEIERETQRDRERERERERDKVCYARSAEVSRDMKFEKFRTKVL